MTDDELMTAWAGGDEPSGEQLFERYYVEIKRFFANKVEQGADDLLQQTFLGLVDARTRFRGEGSFRSFMFSVAYNTLRNHYRARRRDLDRIDFGTVSVQDLCPGPSTMFRKRQEEQRLHDALRTLPLDDQVVLELFDFHAMSAPEVGAILDLPEGTVRSRVRRARQRLREILGETDPDAGGQTPPPGL